MKTKLKFLARSVILLIALLTVNVATWAQTTYTIAANCLYFKAPSDWTNPTLVIKKTDGYTEGPYSGDDFKSVGNGYYVRPFDWTGYASFYFQDGSDTSKKSVEFKQGVSSITCFGIDDDGNWSDKLSVLRDVEFTVGGGTTLIGGRGTETNPYIVHEGTNINVQMAAEILSGHSKEYKFVVDDGSGDYSKTTNNLTINNVQAGHTYKISGYVRAYREDATTNVSLPVEKILYFRVSDKVWRVTGLGGEWEKPEENGKPMTHAYGNVYYYKFDDETPSDDNNNYFRVAEGYQQYNINGTSYELTLDGDILLMKKRISSAISGTQDDASIKAAKSGYICVDTETKEVWLQSSVPTEDKQWRIVGLGKGNWETPTQSPLLMTNAYGSIYYFEYTGASSWFRIAEGKKQYHTGGTAVSIDGTKVDMSQRFSGDNTSIAVPGTCYICIDSNTKQIWYQSSVPNNTLVEGTYIYFDAHNGDTNNWDKEDAKFSVTWWSGDTKVAPESEMEKVDGNIWKVRVPAEGINAIQINRLPPNLSNHWNETAITPVDPKKNCYYPTGWSDAPAGIKDITILNFYWHIENDDTRTKFNTWLLNEEESGTHYANGYHYGFYNDNESETINGKKWYKRTLAFTGVNSTGTTAKLGITVENNNSGDDRFIRLDDLYFNDFRLGESDVYYYGTHLADSKDGAVTGNDYYLIVKKGGNVQSFKMSDSRYRVLGITEALSSKAGKMSNKYYSVVVKADRMADGENECYVATDPDGNHKFAGTWNSHPYKLPFGSSKYGLDNYSSAVYFNTSNDGGNFIVDNVKNDDGSYKYSSYVFQIDVQSSGLLNDYETHHPMQFFANGNINIPNSEEKDGFYVIGNFGGTVSASEQMKPYEAIYRKLMTKYWYSGGNASSNEIAQADSIVYKLDVQRPNEGWAELYLMFAPESVITAWDSDPDKASNNSYWKLLVRPEVDDHHVDATALEGGLIYSNNNTEDFNNMSINPLLTNEQKARYSSYTVYLNVTTSTYRIEFHDAYYLAGTAVVNEEASTAYNATKRILLEATVNPLNGKKSWNYTGQFKQGKKFLVFSNSTSMGFYFHEDDTDMVNPSASNKDDVVAPESEDTDFAYFNHIKYEDGMSGENVRADADDENAMLFNLPTGEYTIRFYDLAEDENGIPFYTIDKVVTLKNASSTSSDAPDGNTGGEENFGGGWATYSDDVATYIPYGVKAYYVDKANNGKVHLKELEKIIPAHCGVLLHNPTLSETSKSYNLIPVVEDKLFTTSLQDLEGDAAAKSLLVDCCQVGTVTNGIATTTSVKVGPGNNVDGYNYFFTNKITASVTRKTGTDASGKDIFETKTETLITPMNFWRSNGNASRKKTYLHVDKEITPALYSNGSFSFNDSESTDESAAKSYCFVMTFADIDDTEQSSVVTAVESVRSVSDTDTYYNIQGMKVDKPTHGLYIKNGKKIYIK